MDKGVLMGMVAKGLLAEAFTWVPDDGGGKEVNYDISALRRMTKTHPERFQQITVPTADISDFVLSNRVWSYARVCALTQADLDDPLLALVVTTSAGIEHIIVDGTHRAIRHAKDGTPILQVLCISENLAPRAPKRSELDQLMDWGASLDSIKRR